MPDPLPLFYWDTNIFFEYLKGEPAPELQRQAITDLLEENKRKQNKICTSSMTHVEVVPRKLPADKEREYWARFNSMHFFDIEVDRSVIMLAREIRNFYYQEKDFKGSYRLMSVGDSIHLATAIIHNVSEFHTRDKNSRNGNVKLLGLPEESPNGKICGVYSLAVVCPVANQGRLDLAPKET